MAVHGLRLENVSMSFPGTKALDEVSLAVMPGEIHALVGHNGSGKSTLIKCLSGYHHPDAGSKLAVDGTEHSLGYGSSSVRSHGVRFVHQNLGLIHEMCVSDNLALEWGHAKGRFGRIDRRAEALRADAAMQSVGYPTAPGKLVGTLKPSERVGVALARAMEGPNKVNYLVLDEPTAAMPGVEAEALFASMRKLKAEGVGMLYVSHHLHEVVDLADRVTVLKDGRIVGAFQRGECDLELLVRLVGGADGSDEGNSGESDLSARSGDVQIWRGVGPANRGLTVTGISNSEIADVSLFVEPGEIVGIAGVTGSGRESVLQMIFGSDGRSGDVTLGDGVGGLIQAGRPYESMKAGVCFVPPDRAIQAVFPSLTYRENLCLPRVNQNRQLRLRHRKEIEAAREWARRLALRPPDPDTVLTQYSGGNQQKIIFARALRLGPKVLLLAEPTQGVDVGAARQIHDIIRSAAEDGAAVLISSSDEEELADLCNRVYVMQRGRICRELQGRELTAGNLVTEVLGGTQHSIHNDQVGRKDAETQ